MKKLLCLVACVALLCACQNAKYSGGDGDYPGTPDGGGTYMEGDDGGGGGPNGGSGEGEDPQEYAGKVTAGEWRDLDHWLFWSKLMTSTQYDQQGSDYTKFCSYWGFYTNNRVAVRVTNESGDPQQDIAIQLLQNDAVVYQARTDNRGETNLFVGLTKEDKNVDAAALTLVVDGKKMEQPVELTAYGQEPQWNECKASVTATTNIDIAFIVDATGSMMDEIDFLKADLTSIISTVQGKNVTANIRTAALFYRDEGDDYLTRESDFTTNLATTTSFIAAQEADGGGDYPEAVHSALEAGLQKLAWREGNSIRLAFMLLDAPPHHENNVLGSLHKSIPLYAQKGIRIIPVAASGVDKQTEFFLRFTAIATDGTYVFLTNHSGIGEDHIEPTIGEYKVELLSDLIVRLINQYME